MYVDYQMVICVLLLKKFTKPLLGYTTLRNYAYLCIGIQKKQYN